MSFKEKYLKYKNKYLELKKQIGGCKGGELCENASRPAAIESASPFEDFLESNGQYVLPYLQYPEGCALEAVGPVTMAMATTVRRWDLLPFFVGTKGDGDGQFNQPYGIAFSSGGDIIVCDTFNHRIQVFDRCGNYLRQWGKKGSAQGQFYRPHSVAISSSDKIYVCDKNNHRIQVFDLSGNYSGQWGKNGLKPGEFESPSGVTIHGDQVFVSDTNNHRIQVFDLNGNYSGQWDKNSSKPVEFNYRYDLVLFDYPYGLAVSSAGDVFVCVYNRVQVFDRTGTFKNSYGDSSPDPKADWRPGCVAISSANEVFISDIKYNRVLVFTIDGIFIRDVKLPAGKNGAFSPAGIAVSSSGLLVICDNYNNGIYFIPPRA
jgi:sugar lactone lactonase YvrE